MLAVCMGVSGRSIRRLRAAELLLNSCVLSGDLAMENWLPSGESTIGKSIGKSPIKNGQCELINGSIHGFFFIAITISIGKSTNLP